MSLFNKALNTTIIYGKKYPIRSSKLLAEEYSVIMNTKGPYFRKTKMDCRVTINIVIARRAQHDAAIIAMTA